MRSSPSDQKISQLISTLIIEHGVLRKLSLMFRDRRDITERRFARFDITCLLEEMYHIYYAKEIKVRLAAFYLSGIFNTVYYQCMIQRNNLVYYVVSL